MTIQEIAQQDAVIQFAALLCVLILLASQVYQYYVLKDQSARIWIFLLATGVFHNAVFYIVLNLDRYTTLNITPLFGSYTAWSSVRVLHLFATWAIVDLFRAIILWSKNHAK